MSIVRCDQAIHVTLWLCAAGFAVCGSLIIGAIVRRLWREREVKDFSHFRESIQPILTGLLEETIEYSAGLTLLRGIMHGRGRRLAEQVLFQDQASPKAQPILQRLAEDLGFVREWQSHLEGASPARTRGLQRCQPVFIRRLRVFTSLDRASNATRLGLIRDGRSWRILARALNDSSRDVQAAALRSLGYIAEARSFPLLIERSREAGSFAGRLPERELIAALAAFPPHMAHHLALLLEEPDARLRVIAVNVLREMAHLQTASQKDSLFTPDRFGEEISNWILVVLPEDQNPDVRAGAADLLAYYKGGDLAQKALDRLMRDQAWYVRLHAVRAAGQLKGTKWILPVSVCLKDSHWRVREAAAHSLAACRPAGVRQLLLTLLSSEDRYAREQILEELERSGIAAKLDVITSDLLCKLDTKPGNSVRLGNPLPSASPEINPKEKADDPVYGPIGGMEACEPVAALVDC